MKKKLIIISVVTIGIVLLFVLLSFTVFTLKRVNYVFLNETSQTIDPPVGFDIEQADNCMDSYFGRNMMFLKESEISDVFGQNMYEYKFVGLTRSFPDLLTVYLAQRKPVFYIADLNGNGGSITDEELFVFDTYEGEQPQAIRILGVGDDIESSLEGQFVKFKDASKWKGEIFSEIAKTLWRLGYNYNAQSDFLNSVIIVSGEIGSVYTLKMETSLGGCFLISNPTVNLENRIISAYGVLLDPKAHKDADYIINEDGTVSESLYGGGSL